MQPDTFRSCFISIVVATGLACAGVQGTDGAGGSSAQGGNATSGGAPGTGGNISGGTTGSGGQLGTGGLANTGGAGGVAGSGGSVGGRFGSRGGQGGEAGRAGSGGATGGTGGIVTGTGGSVVTACGNGLAQTGDVTVNLSSLQQTISGFGVSTAWSSAFTNAQTDPDLLWSTTTGAGLSLHRIRVDQGGSTSETSIAQKAVSYGVKVWSSIWASNTSGQAEATMLQNFATTMKNAGVTLYAMSAGNEPDSNANGAVYYSASGMASWVGSYFGPTLTKTAKLMAPETENWCNFPSYLSALQNNTAAWGYVDIVATHEYGCNPGSYPQLAAAGKEFWETEIYDLNNTTDDGMGSGLRVGALIHNALTVANMNAWHYWWVYSTNNGGLYNTGSKVWTKRLWVEGNYARFVRPGYTRVSTSGSAPSGILLSAFKNPADGAVVVVAINNNSGSTPLSVFVSGGAPCSMTPWVTSSSSSLASQTAISVNNGRFTASLAGQSVTTFVGKP